MFTKAHHLILFWTSSVQFISLQLISLRPIIILSSSLFVGTQLVSFLEVFGPTFWCSSCFLHACSFHHSWLITSTRFGKEYKLWSFILCNFLHYSITSFPLGPYIPHILNITSLCSFLRVRDQISEPCKTGTEYNEVLLGYQPGQVVEWWKSQCFKDYLCPHPQGTDMDMNINIHIHIHISTQRMRTEMVFETLVFSPFNHLT